MKTRPIYFALIIALIISACGGGGGDETPDPCATPIVLTVSSQQSATSGQSDGSVSISATGSNGGLEYKIGTGAFQSSSSFTGLAAGNYTVSVKDNQGCTASLSITITESNSGATTPSFANAVFPIMQSNCATSGCHVSGGTAPFVIANYSDVKANDISIKSRVSARTMPPSGSNALSTDQINTIVAWVDAGAPNN
tara:strand:+ start:173 stop:760 length:588 start_codon:yes stop_codon:yes gene_type:complete